MRPRSGFGAAFYAGLFANQNLDWSDSQLDQPAERGQRLRTGRVLDLRVRRSATPAWADSIDTTATAAGVTGTPTMFIDGRAVDITALTPDSLTTKIEEAAQP